MENVLAPGAFILFGGVRDNGFRFCNAKCQQKASWLQISKEMPPDIVDKHVGEIHRGLCPKCQGSGPIDIHTSYRICSLFLYKTSCRSQQHLCCRGLWKERIKLRMRQFLFLCGWWGFNWGFFVTPVLVVLNIVNAINKN